MNADEPERELGEAVLTLAEYGGAGARRVARDVAAWLAGNPGAEATLEALLGFSPGWRYRRARREQASRLVAFWTNHFATLQGREAARAVASAILRYRTTAWTHDRDSGRRPDGARGELFDILALGETPGEDSLRRLFRGALGETAGPSLSPTSRRCCDHGNTGKAETLGERGRDPTTRG